MGGSLQWGDGVKHHNKRDHYTPSAWIRTTQLLGITTPKTDDENRWRVVLSFSLCLYQLLCDYTKVYLNACPAVAVESTDHRAKSRGLRISLQCDLQVIQPVLIAISINVSTVGSLQLRRVDSR